MRGFSLFVTVLWLSTGSVAGAQDLLPSEVTTLMARAMYFQPEADRTSITGPIIARMRTADLDAVERFLYAEAYSLNFEPEPARDAFWEFRDQDDDFGRVARQRLAIIRINAFGMVDEVLERDIPAYRQRFGISPYDRYGISYPLMQVALQLAARGEADSALDLVADEVRRHDAFDAPYFAYGLPQAFMGLAEENDRGEEFQALNARVVDGIARALERRLAAMPAPGRRATSLPGAMPGTLFDDEILDYHDWTAEFLELRARLESALR